MRNTSLTSKNLKPILSGDISIEIVKIAYREDTVGKRLKLDHIHNLPRYGIILGFSFDCIISKPHKIPVNFKRGKYYLIATTINAKQANTRYNFFLSVIKNTYKDKPSSLLPVLHNIIPLERV